MKYKLFYGEIYYPLGGYEDLKGYYDSIEEAQKYIENEYGDNSSMWAQIVLEDKIVMFGKLEVYDPKIWEWSNEPI
jgi:hypothetical protein